MEAAGGTPADFGLKVRSHPDTLIVTARNKMGTGELVVVRVGLANQFIETTALRRDGESLKLNRKAARGFAGQLANVGKPTSSAEAVPGGWLLKDIPVASILDFLTVFQNDMNSLLTDPAPVRRYIEERSEGELASWDNRGASDRRMQPSLRRCRLHCLIARSVDPIPGPSNDPSAR